MATKLMNVTIDCGAGEGKALAEFYAALFDGSVSEAFGAPYVTFPVDGAPGFLIAEEDDYVPPVWPEEDGKQQKSIHLDFEVSDLQGTIEKALGLGAVKASLQIAPEHFTVLLDPAGHPFCMCRMSE